MDFCAPFADRRTSLWRGLAVALALSCGDDDPTPNVDAALDAPTSGDAVEGDVSPGTDALTDGAPGLTRRLVILHTNDLHSHLTGHAPEADYTPLTARDDDTVGGFARLAARLNMEREAAQGNGRGVLQVDAGDFMMGTLFELLGTSKAAELKLMDDLGYDAVALGNHEFDWTPKGLAGIIAAALKEGVKLPLLASNMQFDPAAPGDDELEKLRDPGPIKTKVVKTVQGLKIGLFGLMGKDAVAVTPTMAPLKFEAIEVAARRMVAELRETDKVDLVIALSHAGIGSNGKGEDEALAQAVPGIDVIISGHTHAKLDAPVKIGNTVIVTTGAYGAYLGRLELEIERASSGVASVSVADYKLLPIDDQVTGVAAVQTKVEGYVGALDAALTPFGLGFRKLLARTTVDLPRGGTEEWPVGNLVVDAYRAIASALQPMEPVAIAVDANGHVRQPIRKGKTGQIWLADSFRVLPLGIGPDAIPGFPLVTFHLNGKDLKAGMELSAASDLVGSDYFLQVSGLRVTYDPARPRFGRVTGLELLPTSGSPVVIDPADTTRCYKVATTYFVAGLLGVVKSMTGGALAVEPKEGDCKTLVGDLSKQMVDANPQAAGVQELKHWQALATYLTRLPDTNGDMVADVPAAYGSKQGRWVRQ